MTVDIKRVQGTYKVQQYNGTGTTDLLVIDPNTGYVVPSTPTNSKVVVTGDLYVLGTRTEVSSTNVTIKDSTIILNQGEPNNGPNGGVTNGVAGIQISRGLAGSDDPGLAAYLQWNDNSYWRGTGQIAQVQGIWEFREGQTDDAYPQYSAIKANAIRIDEASASTVAGGLPRLNIFGNDNPYAVMSVSGTDNYHTRVIDDDDIPNKKYVDNKVYSGSQIATSIVVGQSYLTLADNSVDGVPSEIIGVIDGEPSVKIGTISSGTVVMRVGASVAQFAGVQFVGNQIEPVGTNNDLRLLATGNGQVVVESPLIFQSADAPRPGPGESGIYADTVGGGGTGMYYVTSSTLGVVKTDEFVSRKKALVFSLIF
jgi:hypothetical protein